METPQRKKISADKLSFSEIEFRSITSSLLSSDDDDHTMSIADQEQQSFEFEFGSVMPTSPSNDPYKSSLADHLFYNGVLLPHSFPLQPPNFAVQNFRGTRGRISSASSEDSLMSSRSNSTSSKDSLMSSRSNSTSSRSSSCSSARTSLSSDHSETKLLRRDKLLASKKTTTNSRHQASKQFSSAKLYGSSQTWHFIGTAPVLYPEASRRKKAKIFGEEDLRKKKKAEENISREKYGFSLKFFWWFVSACKECHAMEPTKKGTMCNAERKNGKKVDN